MTSRALHCLKRLAGAAVLTASLAAVDSLVGAPAQAASPAVATSSVATSLLRPSATPRSRRSTERSSASSRKRSAKSQAKRSTSRKTLAKPFARRSKRSLAPTRVSRSARSTRVAAAPELPPVPVFTLPDLAALFPGDSALRHGAALATGGDRPFTALGRSASALLDRMIERARSQLGTRYVLGGAEPGDALDCSSFARYAMEALGIKLPRTAAQQAQVGTPVPRDRSQLKAGDLLTFGLGRRVSHVGIYLGEGRFIHASVKSGQVIETTFERNGLLLRRWQGARRLIATSDTTGTVGG